MKGEDIKGRANNRSALDIGMLKAYNVVVLNRIAPGIAIFLLCGELSCRRAIRLLYTPVAIVLAKYK